MIRNIYFDFIEYCNILFYKIKVSISDNFLIGKIYFHELDKIYVS